MARSTSGVSLSRTFVRTDLFIERCLLIVSGVGLVLVGYFSTSSGSGVPAFEFVELLNGTLCPLPPSITEKCDDDQ